MVAMVGCGQQTPGTGESTAFPDDTLQDWVTYGDYLIELTATSETTLDPDQNELREGEGLFRREFSMSVDGVAWSRPGAKHPAPKTLKWTSGGWQFKNGNLDHRTRINDPNQLRTNHHYLGFCTDAWNHSEEEYRWWCTRIPVVDGKVTSPAPVRDSDGKQVFDAIEGKTPREAGQLLSQTAPDPAAVPYMDKDAIDRYQAVAAAREASPTPR